VLTGFLVLRHILVLTSGGFGVSTLSIIIASLMGRDRYRRNSTTFDQYFALPRGWFLNFDMTTVRNKVLPRLFDVDPSASLTFSFLNRYSPHSASTCERQWLSIVVMRLIAESDFGSQIASKLSGSVIVRI